MSATSFKAGGGSGGAVTGTLADNAVNVSTKLATLPAVANAAAPSWTEAHVVPLSVDLSGALRVSGSGGGGTSSSFTAAFPGSGTAAGFNDGTNMQGARVFDLDTGGGTQYGLGVNLRISAAGGSIEAAAGAGTTGASVLRVVLPTDQSAIPATQSGTWTVQPGNTANTTPWLVSTKADTTPAAPTAASVGVASAQAVAANASRKGLVLVNTSNARISLGFGSAAVLDSGITLYPSGVYEMDEWTFDIGAVNAIASVAASNLAIQEYS